MSRVFHQLLILIAAANTAVLRVARHIAWVALALMVAVILLQVVLRYVFNAALAWSDEGARFLMLWMLGLAAPAAFRWGGFVAIDLLPRSLPRIPSLMLAVALLVLSMLTLSVAVQHGYAHTFGFGGSFDSSSLRVPLEWFGGETVKVQLRYMYGSLLLCIVLLIAVNAELILRAALQLFAPHVALPSDDAASMLPPKEARPEAAEAV